MGHEDTSVGSMNHFDLFVYYENSVKS